MILVGFKDKIVDVFGGKKRKEQQAEQQRIGKLKEVYSSCDGLIDMNEDYFIGNSTPGSVRYDEVKNWCDAYDMFNSLNGEEKLIVKNNMSAIVYNYDRLPEEQQNFQYFYDRIKAYRKYEKDGYHVEFTEREYCLKNCLDCMKIESDYSGFLVKKYDDIARKNIETEQKKVEELGAAINNYRQQNIAMIEEYNNLSSKDVEERFNALREKYGINNGEINQGESKPKGRK